MPGLFKLRLGYKLSPFIRCNLIHYPINFTSIHFTQKTKMDYSLQSYKKKRHTY